MKTKTTEIYVADDGKEFTNRAECEQYEKEVVNRLQSLAYFTVIHTPDLTEGRCHYNRTDIAVECGYGPAEHYALQWAIENFGPTVAFVMGASPIANWFFNKSSAERYREVTHSYLASGVSTIHKVLLSDSPHLLSGFPRPTMLYTEQHQTVSKPVQIKATK